MCPLKVNTTCELSKILLSDKIQGKKPWQLIMWLWRKQEAADPDFTACFYQVMYTTVILKTNKNYSVEVLEYK